MGETSLDSMPWGIAFYIIKANANEHFMFNVITFATMIRVFQAPVRSHRAPHASKCGGTHFHGSTLVASSGIPKASLGAISVNSIKNPRKYHALGDMKSNTCHKISYHIPIHMPCPIRPCGAAVGRRPGHTCPQAARHQPAPYRGHQPRAWHRRCRGETA